MGPNNTSLENNKILSQNSNRGEWDKLDEISLKQEIEYDDIVVDLNQGERKPVIKNLQTNCDDVLNSAPSERSEFSEISLVNNHRCSIQKRPTIGNGIKKEQSTETREEMYQTKLGTPEKSYVCLQRENLELRKQKHHNEKERASDSSKPELKKIFERSLDVHSGKLVFKCLYCEFQSIPFENMMRHINNNTHKRASETGQNNTYEKMKTQTRICGLCLEACDNFKTVEGDMKDVLDTVLPDIDSAAILERVVCAHCTKMLMKCFNFKMACLNTYKYIVSFVNNRDNVKLDLKDIYLSKNGNGTGIPEDEVICGLCMCPVKKCSAISLDVEEGDMLKMMMAQCLPDLDLSPIETPVVCASCHDSLENCFEFTTNCLAVEEKIQKYCENLNVNDRGQIKLSSLVQLTEDESTNEVNGNLVDMIKEEKPICEEEEKAGDRKTDIFKSEPIFCADNESEEESKELEIYLKEESLDIKPDEDDFRRYEDGVVSPPPEDTNRLRRRKVTMYKCDCCSYRTNRKECLKMHLLLHKSSSEVEMYKCDSCVYQTKRKYDLKLHLLRHKSPSETAIYKCDTCSYQTKYKQSLRIHLVLHRTSSEVTMYECDSCSFKTKYRVSIKGHLLLHKKGATIYKCKFCSFRTVKKLGFKKHKQVHIK